MNSHYSMYLKERENFDIVEDEFGFASYQIEGTNCYVRDVFVVSNLRQCGHATKYVDKIMRIAASNGCKYLSTSVCPTGAGSTDSLKAVLGYGFRLFSAQDNFIIFKMDI